MELPPMPTKPGIDETDSLIGGKAAGGVGEDCDNGGSKRCWRFVAILAMIVAAASLVLPSGQGRVDGMGSPAVLPPVPPMEPPVNGGDDDEEVAPPMMYRPFCLIHNYQKTARVLQTSMGNPSQQWAHTPCYSQPEKVRNWMSRGPSNAGPQINRFGAPDAILRTNLTFSPFADRQPILGFGAAFTEAASLNYQTLSEKGKATLMELFFGRSGLGYSLGRFHINSCDFSTKSYSFDEVDGDFELEYFDTNVTHDAQKDGMIDMAKRATALFGEAWASDDQQDGNLRLYASPWSPPSWMKQPTWEDSKRAPHASKMTYSTEPTCLREGTNPTSRYAKAWALYFSKFITAYRNQGVPLWAVTVQNEPEFPAPWEACAYTPRTESEFVAYHLGPQLEQDHPDVKIMVFDHNKDHMVTWVDKIMNQSMPASKFVSGTAYHWYAGGMDRLLDGAVGSPNMHRVQQKLDALNASKDHIVFGSESCHCPYTGYAGGDIEVYWARAERYGHTILADLMAGSNGWVEWNLVLDSVGGPNHLSNLCDATVLAVPHRAVNGSDIPPLFPFEQTNASAKYGVNHGDTRTRAELNALGFPARHLDDGLAVQPMYYYMGHISRYVRPGSRAVMGLVETAQDGFRAFRPAGQDVAGGGVNDLAREGIELTAWPCEGSTRQHFQLTENKQLMVEGHDWLGNPTTSCLGAEIDESFLGIVLKDCKYESATFDVIPTEEVGVVLFRQFNAPATRSESCLVWKPLQNKGGAYGLKGGSQVTYGRCSIPEARWTWDEETGEIRSKVLEEGEVCLTTGWPFLQMGAFSTPNGESDKTVILLNEARNSANYVLYDGDEILLSGSIPPRSIQTVLIDENS